MARAVSSEELRRVEGIVNDMIKAELDVHTEVVPLPQAMAIQVMLYYCNIFPIYIAPFSYPIYISHILITPSDLPLLPCNIMSYCLPLLPILTVFFPLSYHVATLSYCHAILSYHHIMSYQSPPIANNCL